MSADPTGPPDDPVDDEFDHFVKCQNLADKDSIQGKTHEQTCYADIKKRQRTSPRHHWHYCMLPCLKGTKWGNTGKGQIFNLPSVKAAKEYVKHPVLGRRLGYMAGLLVRGLSKHKNNPDVSKIIGRNTRGDWQDNPGIHVGRFWACATLFNHVLNEKRVEAPGNARMAFQIILGKYLGDAKDRNTERLLNDPANHIDTEDEDDLEDPSFNMTINDDSDDHYGFRPDDDDDNNDDDVGAEPGVSVVGGGVKNDAEPGGNVGGGTDAGEAEEEEDTSLELTQVDGAGDTPGGGPTSAKRPRRGRDKSGRGQKRRRGS